MGIAHTDFRQTVRLTGQHKTNILQF